MLRFTHSSWSLMNESTLKRVWRDQVFLNCVSMETQDESSYLYHSALSLSIHIHPCGIIRYGGNIFINNTMTARRVIYKIHSFLWVQRFWTLICSMKLASLKSCCLRSDELYLTYVYIYIMKFRKKPSPLAVRRPQLRDMFKSVPSIARQTNNYPWNTHRTSAFLNQSYFHPPVHPIERNKNTREISLNL